MAHAQLTGLGVGRRTIKLPRIPEVAAVYGRGRGRRARKRIRPFLLAEQRYVEDAAGRGEAGQGGRASPDGAP